MRLSRFFLTACFFALISAYQVLSQAPPPQFTIETSIVITFNGDNASVSALVDSMSTKGFVEESLRKLLPTKSLSFNIQTGPSVRPLDEGWRTEFEKTVLAAKDWNSGVLNFKLDDATRKRLFVETLQRSAADSLDGSAKVTLLNPAKKAVILVLFATWCGPCRTPFPVLNDLYREFSARGLDVIAIEADDEKKADIKLFARQTRIKFPVALASGNLITKFFEISRFQGIPQMFLIADGKLKHVSTGGGDISNATLRTATEEVFKGKE